MLELDRVSAGYGNSIVLRDVSLAVPDASVVALLGSNGAGKTTLLRAASGMLPSVEGRISMDGADLTGGSIEEFSRRGVGHIPEGRSIFPRLSVRDNLRLFARPGQETASLELATSAFPRLGERIGQIAGSLSGGEQQMLALARCYISRPKVILVDEVSLGLAPVIIEDIFRFLDELAAGGTALLLVEQYVTRALAMADYVYVLTKGRITFAGEPSELDAEDIFRDYVGAT